MRRKARPDKKSRTFKIMRAMIFLIFLGAFIYSGGSLFYYYMSAGKAQRNVERLAEQAAETAPRPSPAARPAGSPWPVQAAWELLPRFEDLYEQNTDLAGWISIDGTNIDYPVMLTPLEPEFYLNRNFNKERDANGLPFLDSRCEIKPRSGHLIIYGHNMKSKIMFHHLTSYGEYAFWKEHQYLLFDTIYEQATYQILAAFLFDQGNAREGDFQFYGSVDFESPEEFDDYMEEITSRALYDTGIRAKYGDQLLSLATCEYSARDGRFVVLAKRVS